jgi:hypothetical protein
MAKDVTPSKWAVAFFIVCVIIIVAVTVYQFVRGEIFFGFLGLALLMSTLLIINNWRRRQRAVDAPNPRPE